MLTPNLYSVKIEVMSIEQTELADRAARHAALGEATRLRIADLLAVTDLSPVELQARLGCSSSLLAFHLGALERAGLVTRGRSEGDRRRSYVRLVPGALDGLGPAGATSGTRVVFVCTANSARSQLAAALWRRGSAVPVTSAGTHPAVAVHPGALDAAARHGLDLAPTAPRALGDVAAGDLVVTVCDRAREELGALAALHWSVADPVPLGTAAAFDAAYEDLARRVDGLTARLAA